MLIKTFFSVLIFLFLYQTLLVAQKQGNIWYFGRNAGLDFNSGAPVPLLDGQINIWEGCATIADENGDLLFYTEGISVWNRNHEKMPNGKNLSGSFSATQSAVIVPWPTKTNLYFIFTVDAETGRGGLSYSIVDLTLDNGLGNIMEKNKLLMYPSTEKITAVNHANGRDIWVIGHAWNSNTFNVWLVTPDGLNDTPLQFPSGSIHNGNKVNSIGYMKASPDGSKLAIAAYFRLNFVEIFDFNTQTGEISNPILIEGFTNYYGPYGVEFSPNSSLLYITGGQGKGTMYQVPVSTSGGDINNIGTILASRNNLGAAQLAPDGKIYIAIDGNKYLGVIEFPNSSGTACNYINDGLYLNGRSSAYGLPTFIQSYFLKAAFGYTDTCYRDQTVFMLKDSTSVSEAIWDFGDPASENSNTATGFSAWHTFSDPGTYHVKVTVKEGNQENTSSQEVKIIASPVANLGTDTTLFYGQTLLLDVQQANAIYIWKDGSTNNSFTVSAPGSYNVEVTNSAGCKAYDTIQVFYDQPINADLGKDTTLCPNDILLLDALHPESSYVWQDGSHNATFEVSEPGIYWVDITDAYGNRTTRDSISVNYYSFSEITLHDAFLCKAENITLGATGAKNEESYLWYNDMDDTEPIEENQGLFTTFVKETTSFYVALSNGHCESGRKKITVTIETPKAGIDVATNIIAFGDELPLQGSGGIAYKWEPAIGLSNDTVASPVAAPEDNITYILTVTTEYGCTDTTSIRIIVQNLIVIPNTITPNGDGFNDTWIIENIDRFPGNIVRIYTRIGTLIYEKTNYDQSWDGSYNGSNLPKDTYFYIIDKKDGKKPKTGFIAIVR